MMKSRRRPLFLAIDRSFTIEVDMRIRASPDNQEDIGIEKRQHRTISTLKTMCAT